MQKVISSVGNVRVLPRKSQSSLLTIFEAFSFRKAEYVQFCIV